MKKSWAVVLVLVGIALFSVYKIWADGSVINAPGPVIAATGQNYNYPSSQSPQAGGVLVNDSVIGFRWSNAVVGTTNSLTTLQFPTLPSVSLAQLNQLTPATTGQVAFCNNCVNSNVCVSSGLIVGAWVAVSSGSTSSAQHCM